MASKKKGFTLVELSIVLVIIGLLIGGILAAQSMISTAKINAVAMQIGQFDAGVENFKTKYNYLPGDAPAFGGDGDGVIDGANNNVTYFGCEIANFWNNINPTQFPNSYACNAAGTQPIYGVNVPISKIGKKNSYFIASGVVPNGTYQWSVADTRNFYAILDPSSAQSLSVYNEWDFALTTSTNSAVIPSDLLALDKKIDDGIANSGNVLSGRMYNSAPPSGGANINPATGLCSTTTNYNVSSQNYECTPLIRIGASAGDLQ